MLTDRSLDALVADANPIGETELQTLPVSAAEAELAAAIRAQPRAGGRARFARRPLMGALAAGAVAALALVLAPGRQNTPSSTAWAAPLVRLAEASPLLLLDAPGWTVTRADETDGVEGEMTFENGERSATLHWRGGPIDRWLEDRAHGSSMVTHRTVLGARAQVSQYAGSTDFTATWPEGSRVLEFRSVTTDLAGFERLLAALERVDVDAWLSAMPPSVINGAQRPEVVRGMLADIPVPPGFDAERLEQGPLKDRYQLGAVVTGAVACAWIERWHKARERGDRRTAAAAEAAVATSRDWKILHEMEADGAWSTVLWETVDAMRGDGTWYGRDLWTETQSALGCGRRLGG